MLFKNQALCPTHRANQLQQPENNTEYTRDDHQSDRCCNTLAEIRVKPIAALQQISTDVLDRLQGRTTAQQNRRESRSSQRGQNHRFDAALLDDMYLIGVPVKCAEPDNADYQSGPENRVAVGHPIEDQSKEVLEWLEEIKEHQDENEQEKSY